MSIGSFSQQFSDEVHRRVNQQMRVKAEGIVKIAQRLAPKKTGALATSISYHLDENDYSVQFIVTVGYALFQEFGTRYIPPHPYLRPALNMYFGRDAIFGFDTAMVFPHTIQTDKKLLSHGPGYQMHKSLTERQKHHVRTRLKPVAERYHVGNVSRSKLHVRHY